MVRVQMGASRHSSVSFESDLVVRALLGSSRFRELQVSRATEARLGYGLPVLWLVAHRLGCFASSFSRALFPCRW